MLIALLPQIDVSNLLLGMQVTTCKLRSSTCHRESRGSLAVSLGSSFKWIPIMVCPPFGSMRPALRSYSPMCAETAAQLRLHVLAVPGFPASSMTQHVDAVRKKLVLLLMPFLRRYDYMRQAENMAANRPTMKPPKDDLFAPDLYIPLHAVFTYVVLSACNRFIAGAFKPEVMYNMVRLALQCLCAPFRAPYISVIPRMVLVLSGQCAVLCSLHGRQCAGP